MVYRWFWGGVLMYVACGPESLPHESAPASSTTANESSSSSLDPSPEDGTSSGTLDPQTSSSGAAGSGSSESSSSGSGTGPACEPRDCDGLVYNCADGRDNDGDGLIDMDDPMCLSPCDDAEDQYRTQLPGGGADCLLDCYFDADLGQGNDGCIMNLRCDPADPGADFSCSYDMGLGVCAGQFPLPQSDECRQACEPKVPPGCDCFGCCSFPTPAGTIHIMLDLAYEGCTLEDPSGCYECTPQIEVCGNPCEGCEICFGESALPPGCEAQTCDGGLVCASSCDCPDGGYCFGGCCYPDPAR